MPELRFDTHFQSNGLPVSAHKRILVAVSGGSDSLALLYLLHDWQQRSETNLELFAATVDHGLRPDAAKEANYVAGLCKRLAVPHVTLNWQKPQKCTVNSAAAREARYDLLCSSAQDVGATCIVLGHTMDDQAETLVMRATRKGSTRGLSGMPLCARYATPDWCVSLFRPLLGVLRHQLRDYLSDLGVEWVNDPSNENLEAERVRVRQKLQNFDTLPPAEKIAQLARLSARLRSLVSARTAALLAQHVEMTLGESGTGVDASYLLRPPTDQSSGGEIQPELPEVFAILVLAAGGKPNRVPIEKLEPVIEGYLAGSRVRLALGRCLVTTGKHGARFEREQRNLEPVPNTSEQPSIYDGRWLMASNQRPNEARPFVVGMERFLPASDFPVHRALMKIAARLT